MVKVSERAPKSVLCKSGISAFTYCVNPYTGCSHGCSFCYASFMRRFSGHKEAWGEFVDVKVGAAHILRRQLRKAKPGRVWVSSVTDAYQPLEKKYKLTRACLEALLEVQFPVDVLTRSPLCLRDLDLFEKFKDFSIGFSIGTDNDSMRALFEARAPSIQSRINALRTLRQAGLGTYAFIGPLLPLDAENLVDKLAGNVERVLIDRMNYSGKVAWLYRKHNLEKYLEDQFFLDTGNELAERFENAGIEAELLY